MDPTSFQRQYLKLLLDAIVELRGNNLLNKHGAYFCKWLCKFLCVESKKLLERVNGRTARETTKTLITNFKVLVVEGGRKVTNVANFALEKAGGPSSLDD